MCPRTPLFSIGALRATSSKRGKTPSKAHIINVSWESSFFQWGNLSNFFKKGENSLKSTHNKCVLGDSFLRGTRSAISANSEKGS